MTKYHEFRRIEPAANGKPTNVSVSKLSPELFCNRFQLQKMKDTSALGRAMREILKYQNRVSVPKVYSKRYVNVSELFRLIVFQLRRLVESIPGIIITTRISLLRRTI